MRSDLDAFGDIPIVTANSEYVALAEVAELNFSFVPSQIGRENGKRPVVVTATARQRDLGSFVK
jgi:cobalt-zinc-cadmium resistance protein CzcA